MEAQDLISSSKLIIKDLQLSPEMLEIKAELTYDSLAIQLAQIIDHLISKDFNQLLNALYRIDVSEEKLKSVLATSPEDATLIIARMIIDRELQKVETRKRYSR